MTKYRVTKGIFKGLVFNGTPMLRYSRIWNDDSVGQSFPVENCEKLEDSK